MNEEKNNAVPSSGEAYNTELKKEEAINDTEVNNNKVGNAVSPSDASIASETSSKSSTEKSFNKHEDVSKVKIRTILKQRLKKSNPILKKVISFIIVGIICFGAGLVAGKEINMHGNARVLINRNGMFKQMPNRSFNGGNFNKRQFNNNGNNNNSSKNNQNPSTTPPATNN
jgi:hypothetical protein